jgi:hypothetical protein
MRYVIAVYRSDPPGPPSKRLEPAEVRRVYEVVSGLRGLDPELSEWSVEGDLGYGAALRSEEQVAVELERGAVEWETGEEVRRSYEIAARSRLGRGPARLTVVVGVHGPPGLVAFMPNRAVLELDVSVGFGWPEPPLVQAALASMAAAFEADFGFAGSELRPLQPRALFDEGRPPVGWMTYLAGRLGALPPSLPTGAVAYRAGHGSIVVAHGKAYRDDRREPREAVARVEVALGEAGLLVPVQPR